jgi:hypothetical protein
MLWLLPSRTTQSGPPSSGVHAPAIGKRLQGAPVSGEAAAQLRTICRSGRGAQNSSCAPAGPTRLCCECASRTCVPGSSAVPHEPSSACTGIAAPSAPSSSLSIGPSLHGNSRMYVWLNKAQNT